MIKISILFLSIFISLFFVNYKFSKTVRIFAFNEEETPKEAILSFLTMGLVALLWTIYFSL